MMRTLALHSNFAHPVSGQKHRCDLCVKCRPQNLAEQVCASARPVPMSGLGPPIASGSDVTKCMENADCFTVPMPRMAGMSQFTLDGMLRLADRYKKYVPMIQGDPPAPNLKATRYWSIADGHDWPVYAISPALDRAKCDLTCPVERSDTFNLSGYPRLNKYQRRRSAGGR